MAEWKIDGLRTSTSRCVCIVIIPRKLPVMGNPQTHKIIFPFEFNPCPVHHRHTRITTQQLATTQQQQREVVDAQEEDKKPVTQQTSPPPLHQTPLTTNIHTAPDTKSFQLFLQL